MNENIEKFKREMKRGIRGIDTLVYMLEGGLKSLSGSVDFLEQCFGNKN